MRSAGRVEIWYATRWEPDRPGNPNDPDARGTTRLRGLRADHGRLGFLATARHPVPRTADGAAHSRESGDPAGFRAQVDRYFEAHPEFEDGPTTLYRWRAGDLGFAHIAPAPTGTAVTETHTLVFAPCWLLALVTAVAPAVGIARFVTRRRRAVPGHCPDCGYDLRATPEEGGALLDRCPECGRTS